MSRRRQWIVIALGAALLVGPALLERAAYDKNITGGQVCAVREWLAHYRWRQEMKHGRAPQRHDVKVAGTITVVDSLSGLPPDQAELVARIAGRALQAAGIRPALPESATEQAVAEDYAEGAASP